MFFVASQLFLIFLDWTLERLEIYILYLLKPFKKKHILYVCVCVYTPRFLHAESNACSVRYMDFITLLSGVNLLRTHQGTEAVLLSKPGVLE